MKVLITGAGGFVGKNLRLALSERKDVEVVAFESGDSVSKLPELLRGVAFVFHLAGINRPQDPKEFTTGNLELTQSLCDAVAREIEASGRKIPFVLTSSIQAERDNAYGQSKRGAEQAVFAAAKRHGFPAHVFRLPNVFGKWCRPNYNSAVATFCHNIARGLPIEVRDPAAPLTLVYIDDLVARFIELLDGANASLDAAGFATMTPQYSTTVGEVAELIVRFKESRKTLVTERVGTGLVRALYSTYVSYLPVDAFKYGVPRHGDARGVFVEMLRTPDSGQFSYFTAHPGITRGGHYHHSKTEKFLVIKGHARFKFRHMQTGETYELTTNGDEAEIVETAPGWTHDITNIGQDEMIVMLWANELFDRAKPDTYASPL
ncbi:UDP-2-acetamido-2,6-beta-L-arabino-hexul-4-ose reductase [Variovorax sp. RA8]|uniref:UDP-2-acetamido-2,6-beta-L-arabino-hexul-4-ose reductase n=1 Tax=Variovorax sp. (strain JCM 16519 / RA8) TaxID=662548 RepID=UPI000AAA936C|nr:capsular polysaccharide biosynthesis protein CapF [Variovorax sp. RA8]VTU15174.1 thioester reductase domain protein [Variovorax sp. RA8]